MWRKGMRGKRRYDDEYLQMGLGGDLRFAWAPANSQFIACHACVPRLLGMALPSPHPTIPSEDQNDSINNQAFTQIWLCSLGSVLGSAKNDMIGSRGRPTMGQATPLSISSELHFLARLDHFAPKRDFNV